MVDVPKKNNDPFDGDSKKPPKGLSSKENSPTDSRDVDSLLADAQASLDVLDNQLGADKASPPPKTPPSAHPHHSDVLNNSDKPDKVEQTLSEFSRKVDSFADEIAADSTDIPSPSSPPDAKTSDNSPAASDPNDLLAELAGEIEKLNQENSPQIPPEQSPNDTLSSEKTLQDHPSDDHPASQGSIDDLLAQTDMELHDADTPPSAANPAESPADNGAPAPRTTLPEPQTNTSPRTFSPDTELTDEQSLVDQELTDAVDPNRKSSDPGNTPPNNQETPPPQDQNPYAHFNLAQQAAIRTLHAANKPFASVSHHTRDLLGLIGFITCILSIIAAALILLFR